MPRQCLCYVATMLLIAGCVEGENSTVVTSPQQTVRRKTVVKTDDVEPAPKPVVAPIPLEHLEPAALVDVILNEATSELARLRAGGILGRIGRNAAGESARLKPALQSEQPTIQLAAAIALAGIDDKDDSSIPILTAALQNKNPQVRLVVLNTFTSLGERGQPAAGAIIELLSNENAKVCETAVFTLYSIGPGEEHLPGLLNQLQNDKARPYVLDVIASMRKNSTAALPHLVKLLGTGDKLTQRRLNDALAAIGKPAIPTLTQLIADDQADEAKRIAAAAALGTMGRHAAEALPALRDAANESPPEVGKAIRAAIVLIEAK